MNTQSTSGTTEAALERITDPAKFELLVTAALRIARPEYQSFVHLGVNANRQTVRAALDGAALELRDGAIRVVLLAHTTTSKRALRGKWLAAESHPPVGRRPRRGSQGDAVGDLTKAAKVAAEVRQRVPSARVTVVLTTNRTPDLDLWLDVVAFGAEREIEVEVVDRSTIAHILDNTTEGTAVRRRELGIDSDRLSRDVLHQIGRESVVAYAGEHTLTRPAEWVDREVSRELDHAFAERANIVGLVGESGYGKSALALHALVVILDRGGFALWVPAFLAETASSAAGLLEAALRHWRGALEPEAASKALALTGSEPIVLVVDDAMRTSDPVRALRRLYSVAQPASSTVFPGSADTSGLTSTRQITLVVPAWPSVWATLGQERLKANGVATVSVGDYRSSEAASALKRGLEVRGFDLSARVLSELATRLAGDPFLTAIFLEGMRSESEDGVLEAAEDATERFLLSCLEELAASGRGDCPVAEYLDALTRLAEKCLREGTLEPDWSLVRQWFRGDPLAVRALTQVIAQGQICRASAPPLGRITFRHDRVRDALLSNVIAGSITDADPPEYVGDPFLSVQVGTALRRAQPSAATLELLRECSPSALAEALRQSWGREFPGRDLSVSALTRWVEERFENGKSRGLEDVHYALLDILSRCADPVVTEIVAAWPGRLVRWIRFAHGSLMDGIHACGRGDLEFTHRYPLRDQIIAAAVERHRSVLVSELRRLLGSDELTDDERVSAIMLAGFVQAPELGAEVVAAWNRLDHDPNATSAAIWALLYSAPADLGLLLRPILDSWESLPSEAPEGEHWSTQFEVSENLRFGLRDDLPAGPLNVLRERVVISSGDFAARVASAVSEIDSPEALSIVVHAAALIDREIAGSNSRNMFLSHIADRWNPDYGSWGRAPSPETRQYLQELWSSEANDAETRHSALRIWLASAQPHEASLLRGFPGGTALHRSALWTRCKLGDPTALPEAVPFLATERYWIQALPPLWGPELRAIVDRLIEAPLGPESDGAESDVQSGSFPPWQLARFLLQIPRASAEELLTARWDTLGKTVDYVKVALAIATPATLALVRQSVHAGIRPEQFLKQIGWTLGTRYKSAEGRITVEVLHGLEPYLEFFPTKEADDLAEFCLRNGFEEWACRHLLPRLSSEARANLFPSDSDLDQALDGLEGNHRAWHAQHRAERWTERPGMAPRVVDAAIRHLERNRTVDALRVAAACIEVAGTRADLQRLATIPINGDEIEVHAVHRDIAFMVRRRTME